MSAALARFVEAEVTGELTQDQAKLVLRVRQLIEKKVNKIAPRASPADRCDLVQGGSEGAAKAAKRFLPTYGTRFTSYAVPWICGGIKDILREQGRQKEIRRMAFGGAAAAREYLAEEPDTYDVSWDSDEEIQQRLDAVVDRFLAAGVAGLASAPPDPEEAGSEVEILRRARGIIRGVVEEGPEIERVIFRMRYEEEEPLSAIMNALGVSDKTVRRHHEALLDKLRLALLEGGVTEFSAALIERQG